MTSFFGWVDGDPEHEASVLRALRGAGSQDARDELGLGGVRDAFADAFFPGLSTIQTRARYFLFIQWCCELASRQSTEEAILGALRAREVEVIKALERGREERGVIGIEKQDALERMPSEIYWSGLRLLGMRTTHGAIRQWAQSVLRGRHSGRAMPSAEGQAVAPSTGFLPDRPAIPEGFPGACELKFRLEPDEVRFLGARLANACIDRHSGLGSYNLMSPFQRHKARLGPRTALWNHPRVDRLDANVRDAVALAEAFSHVMHGAVLLYQKRVAQLKAADGNGGLDVLDARTADFTNWVDQLDAELVDRLDQGRTELPALGAKTRHTIDGSVQTFIADWVQRCRGGQTLFDDDRAIVLVSNRERRLKTKLGTSRIASAAARARWRGTAAQAMDYRWGTARTFLNDLTGAA